MEKATPHQLHLKVTVVNGTAQDGAEVRGIHFNAKPYGLVQNDQVW